ncbi:MAG: hypothetical protein R3308_07495, partial [Thiohalobacterales bacterium]|nr:hypothetical protein [Thiohalobacterales bacterium]
GLDQSRLEAFQQRAEQVESEIKALCAKDERDAAESKGLAFAREVNSSPDIQMMRKCGEKMRGMMPQMQILAQVDSPETTGKHICDE